MESSVVTPYLTLFAVVIGGTIVMMRFMPRLMAGVPFVDAKSVHELMEGGAEVVVLDVRTQDEFNGPLGHIPGAVNLAGMELDDRLKAGGAQFAELKHERIFVYCRTHNRSPRAARLLTKSGFTNVAIIKGGMMDWTKQGLPVER